MNRTAISRSRLRNAPGIVLLLVALGGCAATSETGVQTITTQGAVAGAARPGPVADPRSLGRAAAPLALVEYSDYQCPYCRQFHDEVLPQLREHYIDAGKLRFFFRDLPLSMHAEAMPAAIAARCAAEQGKFWPMHDALFADPAQLAPALYPRLAQQLALDGGRFRGCVADPATRTQVEGDVREARHYGLDSTPSFLLGRYDGERLEIERIARGLADFATFAREIDALLAAPAR